MKSQGERIALDDEVSALDDHLPEELVEKTNQLVLATQSKSNKQAGSFDQTFILRQRTERIERQLKRAQSISDSLKSQLHDQIQAEYKVLNDQLGKVNAKLHRFEPVQKSKSQGAGLSRNQIRQQLSGLSKIHTSLLNQGDQVKDQLTARQIKREKLAHLAASLTKRLNDLDYSFSGVIQTIKSMKNPDEAYGALASISAESGSFRALISQTRRQLNEVQAAQKQVETEIDELNHQIGSQNSHMAALGHQLGQIVKVASSQSGIFKRASKQKQPFAHPKPDPQAVALTHLREQRDSLVKRLKLVDLQRQLYGSGHGGASRFIADSGHRYFVYSNTLAPGDEAIDFELKRLMQVFYGVEDETVLLTTQFSDDSSAVFKQCVDRQVISNRVGYTNLYDDLFRRDHRFSGLQTSSLLHTMHEQGWRHVDTEDDGGQIWQRDVLKRTVYLRPSQTVRQIFSYDRNQVLIQVDVFSPEEQLMATQYIKDGNQVSTEDFFRKSDHSVAISKEYRDNKLLTIQIRDRSGILVAMLKDHLDLEKWWFTQKLDQPNDVLVLDGQSELCKRLINDPNRRYQLLPIFSGFDSEKPVEQQIMAGQGNLAGLLVSDESTLEKLATTGRLTVDVSLIGD